MICMALNPSEVPTPKRAPTVAMTPTACPAQSDIPPIRLSASHRTKRGMPLAAGI